MAFLSLGICWLFGEWSGAAGFGATAAGAVLAGQGLLWSTRTAPSMEPRHALIAAAVGWLVVPLVATIPFLESARWAPLPGNGTEIFLHFDNAFFEVLSGFTSTGLSIVPDPSRLPHYLQWWRSFTEWVGGMGVIVFMLAIIRPDRSALYLFFAEAEEEKLLPTVKSTVRTIWGIYLAVTLIGIILFLLAGNPPWLAVNRGMTGIATGGFALTPGNLEGADAGTQVVSMVIMTLGAVSFGIHYGVIRFGQWRALFGSSEARLFWILLLTGAVVTAAEHRWFANPGGVLQGILPWVSALTTTGFNNTDLAQWSQAPLFWLILAMVMGGMAGSTCSGIKQRRVALLLATIRWNIRNVRRSQREVMTYPFDHRRLGEGEATQQIRAATTLVTAYLVVWLAGVFILFHLLPGDTRAERIMFEAASAQSNVGLSTGLVGPDMHTGAKWTLMGLMWMGRLEIFPVLVLLALAVGRR